MLIDTSVQTVFNNLTFQVHSPDGLMFVSIMEDTEGKPCAIEIKVGKAGAPLRAWCHCLGRMVTMAFEKGATLSEIIEELSLQTSDGIRITSNGMKCRSGPEGVYIALMEYRRDKFDQTRKLLGLGADGDERGRGPRMAR